MDFRLLGPLQVAGPDGVLALGGAKQRSVLAVLLLHANQVVSTDRLIDALWGATPPLTAGKTIQVYVSRLRKAIGDDRLVTLAPGYVLYVDATELDLTRFDTMGTAQAILAKQLHLRSVYILDDGSIFWRNLLIDPFRYAARRLGVPIAGQARFQMDAPVDDGLLDEIDRSGAEGVVLTGDPFGGVGLLKALRARFGSRLKIMADFYYAQGPETLEATGGAARGLYVATSDISRAEIGLTPAARRFMQDYGGDDRAAFVLEAAQATELVVQAIARSDGTRASVLKQLKASRVKNGLLGSFRFDRNGDLTPAAVAIMRITDKDRVLDRVVRTPRRLIR